MDQFRGSCTTEVLQHVLSPQSLSFSSKKGAEGISGEISIKLGKTLSYGSICESMRTSPKSSWEKDQVESRIKPQLLCISPSSLRYRGQCLVLRIRWAESVGKDQSEKSAPLREGLGNRDQNKGADICHHDDTKSASGVGSTIFQGHMVPRTHCSLGGLLPLLIWQTLTHYSEAKSNVISTVSSHNDAPHKCPKSSCAPRLSGLAHWP